ncbi:MAG: FAD-binding domain-containing protein [Planctomycetia bacterium]
MTTLLDLSAAFAGDRPTLISRLAEWFPDSLRGQTPESVGRMSVRGGRRAALEQLAAVDPVAYATTRNHVGGAVTKLSPWIRHGVLSLAEVRDAALTRARVPEDATKLVSELGWRDYWRQVHAALGPAIESDIEPAAARRRGGWPLDRMPDDVLAGATGLACIDTFVRQLHETGWLHNHERMWLASWLVHTRGVRWQTGAAWFMEHLLDADPASNHLSWQWVAGTFSAKPYLFNRENLETYTSAAHCPTCPVRGRCDVEGTYDDLSARLFEPADAGTDRPPLRIPPAPPWRPTTGGAQLRRPLVWLTLDALAATSPAVVAHADAPRIFIVDPEWLAAERPTLKRLVFIGECLAEVPGVEVHHGDPAAVLVERARSLGCDVVAVADTPCPRVRRQAETVTTTLPVVVEPCPPFCRRDGVRDLGRFSRYWSKVGASSLVPTSHQR